MRYSVIFCTVLAFATAQCRPQRMGLGNNVGSAQSDSSAAATVNGSNGPRRRRPINDTPQIQNPTPPIVNPQITIVNPPVGVQPPNNFGSLQPVGVPPFPRRPAGSSASASSSSSAVSSGVGGSAVANSANSATSNVVGRGNGNASASSSSSAIAVGK